MSNRCLVLSFYGVVSFPRMNCYWTPLCKMEPKYIWNHILIFYVTLTQRNTYKFFSIKEKEPQDFSASSFHVKVEFIQVSIYFCLLYFHSFFHEYWETSTERNQGPQSDCQWLYELKVFKWCNENHIQLRFCIIVYIPSKWSCATGKPHNMQLKVHMGFSAVK